MPKQLIECIPNISEGRRAEVYDEIVAAIKAVPGVTLLDHTHDTDHNRSVLTFVGPGEALKQAVRVLYTKVLPLIDLTRHSGAHPRMGAVDVVPFVPIRNATMQDCVTLALEVGKMIAEEFKVPVFLYEEAASAPHRGNLSDIRKGEFEGLPEKMKDPRWHPDYGPAQPHPTAGATAVGARMPLIAYNINLGTSDINVAKQIAKAVRGSSGGLVYVKAMGVPLANRPAVQVSMNLVNYKKTPMYRVFEMVRAEAQRYGVPIVGSEIVGLLPQEALLEAAAYYLQVENWSPRLVLENNLEAES